MRKKYKRGSENLNTCPRNRKLDCDGGWGGVSDSPLHAWSQAPAFDHKVEPPSSEMKYSFLS